MLKLLLLVSLAAVVVLETRILQSVLGVRLSIEILSTLPQWLHIVEESFENYKKVLGRGVKYRIIAETPKAEVSLSRDINSCCLGQALY